MRMSNHISSVSQQLSISWSMWTDGATSKMSSAYRKMQCIAKTYDSRDHKSLFFVTDDQKMNTQIANLRSGRENPDKLTTCWLYSSACHRFFYFVVFCVTVFRFNSFRCFLILANRLGHWRSVDHRSRLPIANRLCHWWVCGPPFAIAECKPVRPFMNLRTTVRDCRTQTGSAIDGSVDHRSRLPNTNRLCHWWVCGPPFAIAERSNGSHFHILSRVCLNHRCFRQANMW